MPRSNFTDAQKAEIYVRDRATCAFSGANLWLLDSGVSGDYLIDWADHVKPAAGGGASAVDNGVCACWLYNYAKSDSPYPGVQLFSNGLPTREFFLMGNTLTPENTKRIVRFGNLHSSDWYFNRAIWLVCLGLCWLTDRRRGQTRSRDNVYYAKASLKRIEVWRKLVASKSIPTLESRGLTPKPLQEDQKILLAVREALSTKSILQMMDQLLPFHTANQEAFDAFVTQLYSKRTARSDSVFMKHLRTRSLVTPLVKKRLLQSARFVFG